ncbi:5-formyltetrahydrofolate cyclo-ligase [Amycolatopsis marina]|uniref:5-formyltetrahydrofolate cyclo-ligase n=1 Tax=Amycolatopsis marina TaxID=490629 RepID=A0A1I0Z5U2_9PSEU|nr:5-formyltetrahydrofolate cyclo-ligase [Amycolatopsis marina]
MWKAAKVVKANPDKAQLPVREAALREHKLLYMAVPKIATLKPFYLLDSAKVDVEAAASKRAADVAPTVGPDTMQPVDMVVCGTVAVDRRGVRIGKGAGYSDIEMGLLAEAGLLGPKTVIVTTVHELQVVDGEIPETEHDFRVDLVITPHEIIECPSAPRPPGIIWKHLSQEKISAIPALSSRYATRVQ